MLYPKTGVTMDLCQRFPVIGKTMDDFGKRLSRNEVVSSGHALPRGYNIGNAGISNRILRSIPKEAAFTAASALQERKRYC